MKNFGREEKEGERLVGLKGRRKTGR